MTGQFNMDRLVPKRGDPSTAIDRLIDYICIFDPLFPSRIQGAPLDEIVKYTKLAAMGNSTDSLPSHTTTI